MTNLEQLTKKIIKAVPSIVELKFGCEYLENEIPYTYLNTIYSWCEKRPIETDGNINEEDIEILGRPILLEDVLIALEGELSGDYQLEGNYLTFYKDESDEPEIEWSWKLNTPLHLQGEETISELNKLIE
jgi:hypothetical protein